MGSNPSAPTKRLIMSLLFVFIGTFVPLLCFYYAGSFVPCQHIIQVLFAYLLMIC